MNARALRFVVLELLHGFVEEIYKYHDLLLFLDAVSEKSHLGKHWGEYYFMRPVGKKNIFLFCCSEMLPRLVKII